MNKKRLLYPIIVLTGLLANVQVSAKSTYWERPEVRQFVDEMVQKHQFDRNELKSWFSQSTKRQSIIDAMMRPAESKPWSEYRPIFLTDKRISKGVMFWQQNRELLKKAEQQFGVPPEIIVAIIGVETYYGRQLGRFPVIDALSTLGFDYPPRAAFFKKELEQFLLLARHEKLQMTETLGSYAGAMGMGQFISSSYLEYAVDFDNNGQRDLWHTEDAIGSVANYFKRHGWRMNEPVAVKANSSGKDIPVEGRMMKPDSDLDSLRRRGLEFDRGIKTADNRGVVVKLDGRNGTEYWIGLHNFYVISRYNHSPLYSMAVFQLSEEIKKRIK